MNTKFQLIFLTKYYNKSQNNNFGASSKSAFHLLKNSTWPSGSHVTWGPGSTKPWFNITTKALNFISLNNK